MNRLFKVLLAFMCVATGDMCAMHRNVFDSPVVERAVERDIAAALARVNDTRLMPEIRLKNIARLRQLFAKSNQDHSLGQLEVLEAQIRAEIEAVNARGAGLLERLLHRNATPAVAARSASASSELSAPAMNSEVPVNAAQTTDQVPTAAATDLPAPAVQEPRTGFMEHVRYVASGLMNDLGFTPVAAVQAPAAEEVRRVTFANPMVTDVRSASVDNESLVVDSRIEPTEQDEDAMTHLGLQAGEQDVVLPAQRASVLSRLGDAGSSAWHWVARQGGYVVSGLTAPAESPAVVAQEAPAQTPAVVSNSQPEPSTELVEQVPGFWARLGKSAGEKLRAAYEGAGRNLAYVKDGLLADGNVAASAAPESPANNAETSGEQEAVASAAPASNPVVVPTASVTEQAAAGTGVVADLESGDTETAALASETPQASAQPGLLRRGMQKVASGLWSAWNFVWQSDEESDQK